MEKDSKNICSESGTVIALDFGLARTGVAVGNTITKTAQPLSVLNASTNDARWKAVDLIIAEWHPALLVVGVPRMGDGSPSTLTARCERFARQLGGRYHLRVYTVDERFSSVEVERGREKIDDLAATVILEQFFRETDFA